MLDDPNELLCPEVMVAQHRTHKTLYAFAYCNIYDKKVEQKLLRFFVYGFPNVDSLFNAWVCIPKSGQINDLKPLFDPKAGRDDRNRQIVKGLIAQHVYALKRSQRTAEWFLFRSFHLTATMVGKILNSTLEFHGLVDQDQ